MIALVKAERSSSSESENRNEDRKSERKRNYQRIAENNDSDEHSEPSIDGNQECYLKLDFPTCWEYKQVKEYIETEFEPWTKIEMIRDSRYNYIGEVMMTFDSLSDCNRAKAAFKGKVVKGVKLSPRIVTEDNNKDAETGPPSKTKRGNVNCFWRPDIDVYEEDPTGFYGFKPEFLYSLGISTPLQKWIRVENISCGKYELRGLMELAGEVIECTVDERIGKVKYSHPMEAVQAIMILHGQKYNNLPLKVTMCKPVSHILPKGLQKLGPGLGSNGEPLRDIVRHFVRYAKGRNHSVNTDFFRNSGELLSPLTDLSQTSSQQARNTDPFQNYPPQPTQGRNMYQTYQAMPNSVNLAPRTNQVPMAHPGFPIPNAIAPVPSPMISNVPSFPNGPRPGMHGPAGPHNNAMIANARPIAPGPVPCVIAQTCHSVEISNLPLSTSFATLSQKMSDVGQVLNLQLSSPGCAIVQFATRLQAEKCYQQYNNFCVMGNILKARLI